MQQSHIRIARTPDVNKVLSYLREKLSLLSEAEIIKLALSEKYAKEQEDIEKQQNLRKTYEHAMKEGKKLGDKLLADKGLKREDMSEDDLYNLLKNV